MTEQSWSPRWCDYFEIDPSWLPRVVSGDTTFGTLRSAAATHLGVPAGIPVKLGTADTSCAMLAAGMQPGDLLHSMGTTQVLAAVLEARVRRHQEAVANLGVGSDFKRIFLAGGGAHIAQKLIPEYQRADVRVLDEGSLLGVGRLFQA